MSLSAKKVPELKAMAKAQKIKGFSKMRKAELIAALGGSAPASKEVKPPKKKIVKSKPKIEEVKEVKPPKKKIVKSKPKVEEPKKKPRMTKARLAELRKLKPKYPPPPPPTAKKAKPPKKKVVKKGKGPIVFDLSKPIKPQKGQDFQINDPKKQIKKKSRRGKNLKGELLA